MAYSLHPTANYVKFAKGTREAFEALPQKSDDTLFFVYENDNSTTGTLWLGNKQIGDGSVSTLSDLITGTVEDGALLVYNEDQDEWEPLAVEDVIGIMQGATAQADGAAGLVPVPTAGDENKFLKGDGTWATLPSGTINYNGDQFEVVNGELSLAGFNEADPGTTPLKAVDGSLEWVTPVTESRVNTLINNASSLGLRRVIVQSLNDVVSESYIYLVPNNSSESGNIYDEYMLINGSVEKIGNGSGNINLSNYVATSVYQSEVGDLSQLLRPSGAASSTIVDELNDINERLTWQAIVEE